MAVNTIGAQVSGAALRRFQLRARHAWPVPADQDDVPQTPDVPVEGVAAPLPESASTGYGDRRPIGKEAARPKAGSWTPLVQDLRGYRWWRADVFAGFAIAAIAIPQGMAYAQTAGLPVVAGLYGLLIPVVAYAVLGSSRTLMTGPTATSALMVAPALLAISDDPSTYPALAAMMALLVAGWLLLARIARLGWMSDYLSSPVLLGFMTGLGLTLLSGQLDEFTGAPVIGDTPLDQFVGFGQDAAGNLAWTTVGIAVVTLALLIIGGRWWPRFPMVLVLTVASIVLSDLMNLSERGVAVVGHIPSGIPSVDVPQIGFVQLVELAPVAAGIALVAFADAILTSRSLTTPDHRPIDTNQEFVALAGLNVTAGLMQSFPLGSSGSRSAINIRLGGRTQVVSIVQAVGALLVLLLFTGMLGNLPKATLAALIVYAAFGLLNPKAWLVLLRGSKVEAAIAATLTIGMLTIGLLPSLGLAVLLSILDVVRTSARPHDAVLGWGKEQGRFVDVGRHPGAVIVPGVVVYRLDDRLFFANSDYFASRVREAVDAAPYPVTALVFDAEAVVDLDASGGEKLRSLIEELHDRGITFYLARSRQAFTDQIERLGLDDVIPAGNRHHTVRSAVLAASGVDVAAETDAQ